MTHIQQRTDEAAIWTSVNPILYEGEAGHESDTGREKIGDGATPWTALPYKFGVDSVAGKTGEVELEVADVTGAAPLVSPVFTGAPQAPTPATSDDSERVATTEFVRDLITSVVEDTVAAATLAASPVGSIYMSVDNTNPSEFIGGTWIAWGSGRVPVGVDAGQTEFNTVEETGGEKTHILTVAEIPAHNHLADARTAAGSEFSAFAGTAAGTLFENSLATENKGGGGAHNNLQPYITCYMFKRTA